jgi:hypothetical protein
MVLSLRGGHRESSSEHSDGSEDEVSASSESAVLQFPEDALRNYVTETSLSNSYRVPWQWRNSIGAPTVAAVGVKTEITVRFSKQVAPFKVLDKEKAITVNRVI